MEPDTVRDAGYAGFRRKLIEEIRSHGVDDLEILQLFDRVPRHEFLPEGVQPGRMKTHQYQLDLDRPHRSRLCRLSIFRYYDQRPRTLSLRSVLAAVS